MLDRLIRWLRPAPPNCRLSEQDAKWMEAAERLAEALPRWFRPAPPDPSVIADLVRRCTEAEQRVIAANAKITEARQRLSEQEAKWVELAAGLEIERDEARTEAERLADRCERAEAQAPLVWKPIETAPRDRRIVFAVAVYGSDWAPTPGQFLYWDVWEADASEDWEEEQEIGWRMDDADLWAECPAAPIQEPKR